MKLLTKSEWFLFDSPIGEPEVHYREDDYAIERLVKEDGTTVWFGLGINWTKDPEEDFWRVLSVDESIKEIEPGVYPEERLVFLPCETPVYEIEYLKYLEK